MKYFISEENNPWVATKAKSLKGAKIAAKKNQAYQATKLHISVQQEDGQYVPISDWREGQWLDTPQSEYYR
jgi:hypothetical protein